MKFTCVCPIKQAVSNSFPAVGKSLSFQAVHNFTLSFPFIVGLYNCLIENEFLTAFTTCFISPPPLSSQKTWKFFYILRGEKKRKFFINDCLWANHPYNLSFHAQQHIWPGVLLANWITEIKKTFPSVRQLSERYPPRNKTHNFCFYFFGQVADNLPSRWYANFNRNLRKKKEILWGFLAPVCCRVYLFSPQKM